MVVQKSTETRVVLDNDIATSKPLQFFFYIEMMLHWKRCRVHPATISFSNTILICVLFVPSLLTSFTCNITIVL